MKKILLASVAALALAASAPVLAADDHHDHDSNTQTGGGQSGGGHHDQGGAHPSAGGGTATRGSSHGNGGVTPNTSANPATNATGGTHHTHRGGTTGGGQGILNNTNTTGGSGSTAHNPSMTQGSGGRHGNAINGAGGTANPLTGGGSMTTGTGGRHGFQAAPGRHVDHNSAQIQQLRANRSASRHFHAGSYRGPRGYSYRRWNYGDFLPSLYFTSDYWLNDYSDYDLPYAPPGTIWVRYGDDALLVDRYTGEIITVEYGLFD